jgi:hypothetical protein
MPLEPIDLIPHLAYLQQQVEKMMQVRIWMQNGWHEEKLEKYTDKKLHNINAYLKNILEALPAFLEVPRSPEA